MNLGIDITLIIVILLFYINAVIACRIIINKINRENEKDDFIDENRALVKLIADKVKDDNSKVSVQSYREMKQSLSLEKKKNTGLRDIWALRNWRKNM